MWHFSRRGGHWPSDFNDGIMWKLTIMKGANRIMAEYTAIFEAGNALVALLREQLTPEPITSPELIALASPHESENMKLTVWLFHIEEDSQNTQSGYYQQSRDIQSIRPTGFQLSYLITPHSKAPAQLKEADLHRILGAVIQIIKDNPVITQKYLDGSILNTAADIHLTTERANFDQMIKIWNNTQSPYRTSIVCKLSGVSIDSKRVRSITRVTEVLINTEDKGGMK